MIEILDSSENFEVGIPLGTKSAAPELVEKARRDAYQSEMLSANGKNQQPVNKVHIPPSQGEQILFAKPRVSGGDDQGAQVLARADTLRQDALLA